MSVPDYSYSRNVPGTLNYIFLFNNIILIGLEMK